MKRIWAYAFEIGIVMMGILLVINLLFPTFLSEGIYSCMLILFLGAELNTLIASQTLRPLLPKFSRKKKKEAERK